MKCSIALLLKPGNFLRPASLGLACLVWAGLSAPAQVRPRHGQELPDFDSRAPATAKAARGTERQAGQSHLADRLPSASVAFDPLLDSPKFIQARDGFLSGPNGQGRAVSSAAVQALPAGAAYAPIKAFLNEHASLFGHGAEVLNDARVQRDYTDAHNGLHTIVWEQQLEGIPVFQSTLMGHITKRGELTSLASRFLPDLAVAADAGTPGRANLQSAPRISAADAILLAGQNIGASMAAADIVPADGSVGGYLRYKTPQPASARLVWFPLHRSALRLAWEVQVTKPSPIDSYQLVIDAQTGKALLRKNMTCHISDATYSVYDSYSPSPMGPGLQTPGTYQPPLTNRVTITTPALDTTASPDGWIPDGSNTTTGNNIDAFVDRNEDGVPDRPRPVGNPNRVFNFPLDLATDPTNYMDASTIQLFWRANWYHDRLYQLGFTEAAGNFQDNNFGRGGLGNDHIICYVQAGADVGDTDNSFFVPSPDGVNGACYMFVFTGPSPQRDGSLDQEVVTHELTHGTSYRLVGGGNMSLGSLQGDGMGEGWSDFYGETLLNPTNSSPDMAYAMGGYVTYLLAGTGMTENYYFGIRRYPYSTDMTKNPLTFKDIDPNQALAHKGVPLSPIFSPWSPYGADEVHNQGEVWCVTLWEMHANLVHKYGWQVGNELTLQLTTDGMKLTPAFPNFLQARDAILLADQVDNGGANLAEIWQAFAKRGMGGGATSPDGSTTAGIHEAYDVPNISSVGLAVIQEQLFGGNGNGLIEYNECNSLNLTVTNLGTAPVTGISVTLSTITPGAAIAQPVADYANLPAGGTGLNQVPFKISTSPTFVCGTPIEILVQFTSDQGIGFNKLVFPTGAPGTPVRFDNNTPVPLPMPGSATSPITVTNISFALQNATVSLFVEDLFDTFLTLELISPDGTTNLLSANNGLFGANYGLSCAPDSQRTTFDDAAALPISSGSAPFLGSYKPTQPLANFQGKSGTNVNGTWLLRATDSLGLEVSVIHCWSLFLTPTLCANGGGQCPGADLALGMTGQPAAVISGNNLSYSLSITNFGPSTPTNIIVTQLLPGNVTLVAASASQGNYSLQGNVLTFALGTLGIRSTASASVVVRAADVGPISSTASVGSEQPDFIPGNNSAIVTSLVTPSTTDIAVSLSASPNPVLIGRPLTYHVSVINNGPSSASSITVTNVLPIASQVQSATFSQGTTLSSGNVIFWSVPSLAMGASATATIVVTPTAEGILNATVSGGAAEFDPLAANNHASVSTTVGAAADLALSLAESPNPVVGGSNIVYVVTVSNLGPSIATGVLVSHALPDAVSVLSSNVSQGTLSASNTVLLWDLGTLASGAKGTLSVTARTSTNTTLFSTATATAAQTDPNTANNTDTTTTQVTPPGVAIAAAGATLTAESGPVNGAIDIGEIVTVILRLRNSSNMTTLNLQGTLATNSGVVPYPPNNPQANVQAFGALVPSGFAVGRAFSFTATGTNGGTITPTLLLRDGSTTYPPVSFSFSLPTTHSYASTNVIIIPETPNPAYAAGSGPANPYPSKINVPSFTGLLGKVTVTLSNVSHSFPGDINALLVSPSGSKTLLMSHAGSANQSAGGLNLTFDDAASTELPPTGQLSSGSYLPSAYAPDTRLGGFPTNAPAGPYPAVLSAHNGANAVGDWSLYVFDDFSGDTGAISNGWSLALTSILPVNQVADLTLAAGVLPNPGVVGGTLTYRYSVTNAGPNPATAVAFTNLLPAGLTLISAGASQGAVFTAPGMVYANLGPLNPGAVATVTNVLAVTGSAIPQGATTGSVTNVASVAANEVDLNPGNNAISLVTTVSRPVADLALVQTVAPDPVVVAYALTNTVVVTNRGPGIAVAAVLTQPIPAGAGFIAASSSSTAGTLTSTNGTITCALGDLSSNTAAIVVIVLTNAQAGFMTNAVTISSASSDPVPANNTATYVATVVNPSPHITAAGAVLRFESGPINGVIDPSESVNLSLALANIGTLDTANLKATLLATGGVTAPSAAQSYGAMIYGGPSVARNFAFKAASVLGSATTLTLQLQDERPTTTNSLGTVAFTFNAPGSVSLSSSAAIAIPDFGAATPYPSIINVSGLTGRVSQATLTLSNLTHSFPHDISVLLVSPSGSNVLVMSHTGKNYSVTNLNLTFDDSASASLPNSAALVSGTYKPTSYEGPVTLPGTVSSRYQFALSGMKWSQAMGDWSLYVYDGTTGDDGVIAGGWSLNLSTLVTVGPVVDLAVGVTAPSVITAGTTMTSTITITNSGPDTATGVMLTNFLPAGASFVSATLSQGSLASTTGGEVICSLGSFPAGASATLEVVSLAAQAGALVNTVTIGANEEDIVPANNTAEAMTAAYGSGSVLTGYFDAGHFHLVVIAEPNHAYVVQACTNIVGGASGWTSLTTNNNPTGTFIYTDTTQPAPRQRFYRTVRQ